MVNSLLVLFKDPYLPENLSLEGLYLIFVLFKAVVDPPGQPNLLLMYFVKEDFYHILLDVILFAFIFIFNNLVAVIKVSRFGTE